jgi:hypothetical protein
LTGSDISTLEDLAIRSTADFVVDVDDERLNKFIVGSAQFGSLLLDLLHFVFVHGWAIETKFILLY